MPGLFARCERPTTITSSRVSTIRKPPARTSVESGAERRTSIPIHRTPGPTSPSRPSGSRRRLPGIFERGWSPRGPRRPSEVDTALEECPGRGETHEEPDTFRVPSPLRSRAMQLDAAAAVPWRGGSPADIAICRRFRGSAHQPREQGRGAVRFRKGTPDPPSLARNRHSPSCAFYDEGLGGSTLGEDREG